MNLTPLLTASPVIQIHVAAALSALILGAAILFRRKGNWAHRLAGRLWVALVVLTALTSFFIWEIRMVWLFSPIHLLSVFSLLVLIYSVRTAMRGNIAAHQRSFKALYVVGFVVTGLFTLLPGRLMAELLLEPALKTDFAIPSALDKIMLNTPVWVWPLLAILLAIGLYKSRPNAVYIGQYVMLPIVLCSISVITSALSATPDAALAGTAILGVLGAAAGFKIAKRDPITRLENGKLLLAGEWWTMGVIATVFITRFFQGAVVGMGIPLAQSTLFVFAAAGLIGAGAGLTAGRVAGHLIAYRKAAQDKPK